MGRLTNHFDYCEFIECKWRDSELAKTDKCKFFDASSRNKCHEKAVYEKLRDYEDAEEQGLLVRLPCRVGDTVWQVLDWIREYTVTAFGIYENKIVVCTENIKSGIGFSFDLNRIGKRYFLAKAEAEKALAEMEE